MNDDLISRLRAELDRVQPRHSAPRYLSASPRPVAWRFAPAVLVASVISILVLTAYVATGSPNPADWGHDVVTIIQTGSTTPTPKIHPSPKPTPTPSVKPSHEPNEHESPEPSEPAEHRSPEPSDDHSGSGDGGGDSSGHDGGGSDGGESHEGSTSDSD